MIIDVLVADIGSTTTKVIAFDQIGSGHPKYLGQGFAPTSILQGDVTIGLKQAMDDLGRKLSADQIDSRDFFACSSAAGGLKMSVHGLVYDMTARAAKEAALGAGANLKMITAGKITSEDLSQIRVLGLNIILIAGGVDYGEKETAVYNASVIAALQMDVPVIYAGNVAGREAVRQAFFDHHQENLLFITGNVYPKIDVLRVEAARKVIQDVFEAHITQAPGMGKIRTMIGEKIIPTPGAVMKSALLLQKVIGDLVVADVGGATTDIHSVTEGSPETLKKSMAPEPFAKRTVEGDLGVYVNRNHLIDLAGKANMAKELGISDAQLAALLDRYQPIPDPEQIPVVEHLTKTALRIGLERHAGRYVNVFGSGGMTAVPEGKDLTAVRYVIGTGGALSRLPSGKKLLADMIRTGDKRLLFPNETAHLRIDADYVFAACGAIADKYPDAAVQLLKNSLGIR